MSTVTRIVTNLLPPGIDALAFGSRVHGRTMKPFSDLDICLRSHHPIADGVVRSLQEAFEESNLPFKVDIIDWSQISPDFQRAIAMDLTPLR